MMNLMMSRLKMIFCNGVWNWVVLVLVFVMVLKMSFRSLGDKMIISILNIGFMVCFILLIISVVISWSDSNSVNCLGRICV